MIFKQAQEALGVFGTHLPVFANQPLQHIPPPAQVKQPEQVGTVVAVPEVATLVHLVVVPQDLLLRLVSGRLLPCLVQGVSLGHPAAELGLVPGVVLQESAVQI